MTDQLITTIATQLPVVAILLWVMSQQTKAHQESINYYRAELAALYRMVLSKYLENAPSLSALEVETLAARIEQLNPKKKGPNNLN